MRVLGVLENWAGKVCWACLNKHALGTKLARPAPTTFTVNSFTPTFFAAPSTSTATTCAKSLHVLRPPKIIRAAGIEIIP